MIVSIKQVKTQKMFPNVWHVSGNDSYNSTTGVVVITPNTHTKKHKSTTKLFIPLQSYISNYIYANTEKQR